MNNTRIEHIIGEINGQKQVSYVIAMLDDTTKETVVGMKSNPVVAGALIMSLIDNSWDKLDPCIQGALIKFMIDKIRQHIDAKCLCKHEQQPKPNIEDIFRQIVNRGK